MNIVWLTPEPPVPPMTGGRERSRRVIEYVAKRHAVHLITFAAPKELSLLTRLHGAVANVTAIPYPSRWGRFSTKMHQAVERAVRAHPDAIHVQGLDMARYVPPDPTLCCNLELHDVPSLLEERLMCVKHLSPGKLRHRLGLIRVRCRERAAVRRASAVVAVSEQDRMAVLSAHGDHARQVITVPNGVDLGYWIPSDTIPEPYTVLFPGAFNWWPNVDAARVLTQSVLPCVRVRLPRAKAIIAGSEPCPAVRAMAQADPAVTLVSDPVDMRPLFAQAAAIVVPMRAASGARHKILQALAVRRPVVSTGIGAEGLELEADSHLLVAPVVEAFAEALIHLLTHPARQAALVRAGRAVISRHAWEKLLPALDALYPRSL